MSTLSKYIELEQQVSNDEWNESTRGKLQLADEEAKLGKFEWFKLDPNKAKVVFIPKVAEDPFDSNKVKNNPITKYKLLHKASETYITKNTKEEVEEDEKYLELKGKYDDEELKIDLRYLVLLFEADEDGNCVGPLKWDLAKTKFGGIFGEYVNAETRVLSMKGNKDPKAIPFIKPLTPDELKRAKKAGFPV